MSKWMEKLIAKHTCTFCDKKINKKEIYTVNLDTADGSHTMNACEPCAMEFDEVLKQIEEARYDSTI